MKSCELTVEARWVVIRSDYDYSAVEELKSAIDHGDRDYEPSDRSWRVKPEHEGFLQGWATRHFDEAHLVAKEGSETITTNLHTGQVQRQGSLF